MLASYADSFRHLHWELQETFLYRHGLVSLLLLSRQITSCNCRARFEISNCCSLLKEEYAPQTAIRMLDICFLVSGFTRRDVFIGNVTVVVDAWSTIFDVCLC